MSKLKPAFFGKNAKADNWNKAGAVIKVEYDKDNSIKLPEYDDEGNKSGDEVISTSFNLKVECTQEKLAAKVMLANKIDFLADLGLAGGSITATEEDVAGGQAGEKEVVVTIAEKEGT